MFGEWESRFGNGWEYGIGDIGLGSCAPMAAQITATATQYGIDPTVAYNLLQQESGCNPKALSPMGALGIAQFMPGTWLQWGSSNPADRTDIQKSLDSFGAYFKDLLDTFGGDYTQAVAAYNAGPGAVNYYGGVPPFPETQNYVARILGGVTPVASTPVAPTDMTSVDTTGSGIDLSSVLGGSSLAAGATGGIGLIALAAIAFLVLSRR